MAKRKEESPPPGAPAWMATFGDLMNLLLCFFVLLFSMSSVDAQKFELLAASFSQTFSIFSGGASSIGDGLLVSNGVSQLNQLDEYFNSTGKSAEGTEEIKDALNEVEAEKMKMSEELAEKISEAVEEQHLTDVVDVDFTSEYVQLTLNGALLFNSGSSELIEKSLPVLEKVGLILSRYAQSIIEVEGHTDNVPISSARFADNNELSSARALTVFDFFVNHSTLSPAMIKHSGRGEYVPVADNATPEGRSKNRRVEIKIYHTLSSY
ncbi:MAG: flagellar motor protein MotB [Lachnospiraceae bacterium]